MRKSLSCLLVCLPAIIALGIWYSGAPVTGAPSPAPRKSDLPNIILVLVDDLGYDDLGCFWTANSKPGYEKIETPILDKMAAEGAMFTDFYVAAPVCIPSRAGLMTSCYAPRVGVEQFDRRSNRRATGRRLTGLHADEVTIAEIVKETVCREVTSSIDLLPTIAKVVGGKISAGHVKDGKDISPLMYAEKDAKSPHQAFFYYHFNVLGAVRRGPWKLVFEQNKEPGAAKVKALYNLEKDISEAQDVKRQNPEIVKHLKKLCATMREDLGDANTGSKGTNRRPRGIARRGPWF